MSKLTEEVYKYKDLILDAHEYIWANPETGYREVKTTKYLADEFEKLGYKLNFADGITGFYTDVDTGRNGPTVLVLGELDSLICPDHPDADKETGAVHCCGHSAQSAALLGVAAALKSGDLSALSGKIRLCAVPAEELIEIEYRDELIRDGKIRYYGGKSEFLHRGYFDGVDLALMVHASTGAIASVNNGSNGCVAKRVTYKGVSAHAGGAPHEGVNALYAATQGLSAVNAIRETFKDGDTIRVHPIITNGGAVVNAIPDCVTIESFVRGKSFQAIKDANFRVNRALIGAALSLGANIEIADKCGYAPHENAPSMIELALDAAKECGIPATHYDDITTASTDMGDLSRVMPIVHAYSSGAEGTLHGADFKITDVFRACVESAKWQLCMIEKLLENGGARAEEIVRGYQPEFKSKEDYFKFTDSFECGGARIKYTEGEAHVTL